MTAFVVWPSNGCFRKLGQTNHARSPRRSTCRSMEKAEVDGVVRTIFGGRDESFDRKSIARQDADKRGLSKDLNLTYGEYDMDLFIRLINRAEPRDGDVFMDLGSGCGRLVFASWLLFEAWSKCIGIEVVQDLHREAVSSREEVTNLLGSMGLPLPRAPIEFMCSDFNDISLENADVVFCYSTTWDSAGPVLTNLSRLLADQLRPGTRVITTDKRLAEICSEDGRGFQLLAEIEGSNRDTYTSIGYVWRRVDQADRDDPLPPPTLSY